MSKSKRNQFLLTGKFVRKNGDRCILVPENNPANIVKLRGNALQYAMHGDRVECLVAQNRSRSELVGSVKRILSRAIDTLVVRVEVSGDKMYGIPVDGRIQPKILLEKNPELLLVNNTLAEVRIKNYPSKNSIGTGIVKSVIGIHGDERTSIDVILKNKNVKQEFPPAVLDESKSVEKDVSPDRHPERRVLVCPIFTIDDEDAKDFDDAISISTAKNGNFLLGVHIADVSHYVAEDSALDTEALRRGNSIYLPDRVIPMLPEELSNGVCSLKENLFRLAVSVDMEIDGEGNVVRKNFGRTIVKVLKRLTYTQTDKLIENGFKHHEDIPDEIAKALDLSERLRRILYDRRIREGGLDIYTKEVKLLLDEESKIREIKTIDKTPARNLIEEFMVLANETVASHLFAGNTPSIYRVHEKPDESAVEEFFKYAKSVGYSYGRNKNLPFMLQDVLRQSKGSAEETLISTVMLRSLKQAKYSVKNLGHFGLASACYTHFTSPIRRYPDLAVHRQLLRVLRDGKNLAGIIDKLNETAERCSNTERLAVETERECVKLKLLESVKDKIGREFTARVSSVQPYGMFVELESTLEGLIHISNLGGYVKYGSSPPSLYDTVRKKKYVIGTNIKCVIRKVDLEKRMLDLSIV